MAYLIIIIFLITLGLCFLEDHIKKYRTFLYIILGVVLILVAGLREIGLDPDSENYEYTYQNYYQTKATGSVEYSYLLLSQILNVITSDAHAIFLFYALFGVMLKFIAFRQLTDFWFLPVLIYLSYYFELHELTQMRTGLLSGIFLLAIKPLAEGNKRKAFLLILCGTIFHYSALTLLPFLFLDNKKMNKKQQIFWISLIPFGYIFYFAGMNILLNIDIPYIGDKLAMYQKATEKGVMNVTINVFSPLQLLHVCLFCYLMYFYETILRFNKYSTILLKICAVGLFVFPALSFLPILAQRVSYLFCIVNIPLYTNILYTIKPKWISLAFIAFVSVIILNYGLSYIEFYLLWKI